MERKTYLAAFALLAFASSSSAAAESLHTTDGFELSATVWQVEEPRAGALLLPPCDADRMVMTAFGDRLATQEVLALSVDFRGLGGSRSDALDLEAAPSRDAWSKAQAGFPLDVEAGLDRLRTLLPRGAPVALVGQSCGGREALRSASAGQIEALVLISSRLEGDDLDRFRELSRTKPVFAAAARGDRRAADAARSVEPSPRNASRLYDGAAHATELLRAHPELVNEVVDWLVDALDESPM